MIQDETNKCNKTKNTGTRRIEMLRKCITKIVRDNWNKECCLTHRIGLYSFGEKLKREQKPIIRSEENEELILDKFEGTETSQLNSILPWDALEELIDCSR